MDQAVFIPLEDKIFRMLDHGEEVGDQNGVEGPDGGGEGGVGAGTSGGGRV